MQERQFYCVSCGKKVTLPAEQVKFKKMKNSKRKGGVPALMGKCGCGQKMYKWVKVASAPMLAKKY